MNKPFFSIIIPTYNRAEFLKIAIDSVLDQTYEEFELIVVDDGSTDNTQELLSEYLDPRINYTKQPHQGVSKARNTGIKASRGEFICLLDSDDRFLQDKLEITYHYINEHSDYKIFHTDEIWYRNGALLPQKKYHQKPTGFVFKDAVKLCCIGTSTVVIKKDVFDKIGLFDESMPTCEDYDLWLRITAKYPVFHIAKELTIKQGGHIDQQSHKYPAMDTYRIYALNRIINSGTLSDKQMKIAFSELKNKCSIYIQGATKRGKIDDAKQYQDIIDDCRQLIEGNDNA